MGSRKQRGGKRQRKTDRTITPDNASLVSNPFAGLAGLSSALPAEPEPEPAPAPEEAEPAKTEVDESPWRSPGALAGKLVIRRQRKGHGGKTITRVSGISLAGAELEQLARALRREFGCSGRVEGEDIILGGARQQQLSDWLRARGAGTVVIGS